MKAKRNLILTCLLGAMLLLALTSKAQPVVTKVAAGEDHTLFLKSDGSLWAMGDNQYGELGDGTTAYSYSPEQIVASSVTAIAVGEYHSLFVKSDGSLWVMGYNDEGQLGDGTHGSYTASPEMILASGVTAVAAGSNHSLFLKNDGTMWGMGDNSYGQLGGSPSGFSVSPVEIVTSGVTRIAAGGNHNLFTTKVSGNTTKLWVMGDNAYGQLGVGNTNTPVPPNSPVNILSASIVSGVPVVAIATGLRHSLFVKSDGSLWAMGDNYTGQLGDGTTDSNHYYTNKPEEIVTSGVATVSAGDYHSMFLKNDGSLWVMGDNQYGDLGDNNTYDDGFGDTYGNSSFVPEEILTGSVTAIAAGGFDSLFIKSDGSLWGMGDGSDGKLGDGGIGSFIPEEIVFPPPPALGITTYSNQPVVIFPTTSGTNYILQMTTNLATPNWVTAPGGTPFSGVQFTNLPGSVFFRLQPPP